MSNTVSITVPVQGTCPAGHTVTYDLPTSVIAGSHGCASVNATCPEHKQPVSLSGTYTT